MNSQFNELTEQELMEVDGGIAPIIIAGAKILVESAIAGFIGKAAMDLFN